MTVEQLPQQSGQRHPPKGGRWVGATTLRPGQAGVWVQHAGWWYRTRVVQVGGNTGRAKTALVEIAIRDGRVRTFKVQTAVLEAPAPSSE